MEFKFTGTATTVIFFIVFLWWMEVVRFDFSKFDSNNTVCIKGYRYDIVDDTVRVQKINGKFVTCGENKK